MQIFKILISNWNDFISKLTCCFWKRCVERYSDLKMKTKPVSVMSKLFALIKDVSTFKYMLPFFYRRPFPTQYTLMALLLALHCLVDLPYTLQRLQISGRRRIFYDSCLNLSWLSPKASTIPLTSFLMAVNGKPQICRTWINWHTKNTLMIYF